MPGFTGTSWPTHRRREKQRSVAWRRAKSRAARERAAAARERRPVDPDLGNAYRIRWAYR